MSSSPIFRGASWSGSLKTGDAVPAALFLIGQEKWLKAQAIDRLKGSCLKPGFEEADLTRFPEMRDVSQEILEALETLPFGSPRRLIILDGLEEIGESTFPWLAGYLAHPNPKACLVVCAGRLQGERTIFLEEQRNGRAQLMLCQPLKGEELRRWLIAQAELLQKNLEPSAAALLIRRLGSELSIFEGALELLSLYVGSRTKITSEDVEALVNPSVKETAFDILNQAASNHPEVAIGLLRQGLAQGKISVEQLTGALGWIYRSAWKSRRGSASELEEAFRQVLEADVSLKLGNPAPEFLADRLLLQLARRGVSVY